MKKLILFALGIVFAQLSFSQLTIDGEFRTRYEYRDGYKRMLLDTEKPMALIGQRSRINFDYKTRTVETKLSLQDARMWGEDKWKSDNNGVGLYEAWAKYNFNKNIAIQAGRMELVYDDARLFCNGDWRTFGQSHDVARLILFSKKHHMTIHIGGAINNDAINQKKKEYEFGVMDEAYDLNSAQYKNLTYIWANKKFLSNKLNISLIGVRDGFQLIDADATIHPDTLKYRLTAGTFIQFKTGGLAIQGSYYMQTGQNKYGKDLNSNFYNIFASYKASNSINFGVGYDHYSGTDLSNATEDNTFENLYGPGHKYLGYMDYFGIASSHKAGINDAFAQLTIKYKQKHSLLMAYHMFSLDQEYLHVKEGEQIDAKQTDKNLGSEIDLVYTYKATKEVNFKIGVSTMLYTESMEMLKGIEAGKGMPAQFGWIQMQIKPKFFRGGSSSNKDTSKNQRRDRPVIQPNKSNRK